VLRFAGHELDPQRAELRSPNGEAIKLRPKSFDMLSLFATNSGRVLSKQELIEAVWPNVHVSEDSLFQCIRDIRNALGDERRELIRLVSGRGYLFDVEVTNGSPATTRPAVDLPTAVPEIAAAAPKTAVASARRQNAFGRRGQGALAVVAGLVALIGLAAAVPIIASGLLFAPKPPAIAVAPMATAGTDPQIAGMAAGVTERLTNGLARIEGIRVVAPRATASLAPQGASAQPADFLVSGEIQKGTASWEVQARMISASTGEVRWTTSVTVGLDDGDPAILQSRLAAGIGHPLALRLNALINAGSRQSKGELPDGGTKVVIEQATAVINQSTRERFSAAQTMLEKALAADPDNVDLEVALASHLMRGIQTVWSNPADIPATESRARAMLERALQARPGYIPAREAYCRFYAATNGLAEGLLACARALSFDPWNGTALFNLGIIQILQGRFEEALATFKQADAYDTPQVSRWTWLLGAGLACTLLERYDEALPWLQRSLVITPGTGRTQMLLAGVLHKLGRDEEARTEMAKGLALRPGSNATNIGLPTRNASPVFITATDKLRKIEVEAGLPEQ
jgi:DNA-binding winged helix-turn-helix (wHTH) protein/tetratricopeptide (TPR) repeat protein/TolB-like protein